MDLEKTLSPLNHKSLHQLKSNDQVTCAQILNFINLSLDQEKSISKKISSYFSLATIDRSGNPKNRILAIREITETSLLFFTQKSSRKVLELKLNPISSANIWLPHQDTQFTFVGKTTPISEGENDLYWFSYPRLNQIRFLTYGPISGNIIKDSFELDQSLNTKLKELKDIDNIPRPHSYVGYRLVFETIEIYRMNSDTISDSLRFEKDLNDFWKVIRLAP